MTDYIFLTDDLSDEDYNLFYSLMSADRKNKVDRLKFIVDKKSTVAGEMLVKKHYGIDSYIEYDKKGKPYLVNKKGKFSISHSKGFVLASVSDSEVGCDIEAIRKVGLKAAKKACNKQELIYIFGKIPEASDFESADENTVIRFLEIWTFKEAYFKYLGTGIGDFSLVDYFDEGIRRKKEITKDYVIHIVY